MHPQSSTLWTRRVLAGLMFVLLLMLIPAGRVLRGQSDGMFFVNEAPLTDTVRGVSGFAADFEKSGVRDRKGRSLKDLDLKRRFLRYPLSYLIYSPGFDALPSPAKDFFYERAKAILSGADTADFGHLSAEDRTAIYEILLDTKPDFARVARQ